MSNEFERVIECSGFANGNEQSQAKVNYYLAKLKTCLEIWQDAFKGVAPCHNITVTIKRRRLYGQERKSSEGAIDPH